MSQPKINVNQLDTGSGENALLTPATFFTVGSGRTVTSVHGQITGLSGTSVIPFDSTAPLITEGTQFGTATFTKAYTDSHIHFDFSLTLDANQNNTFIVVAVFRDNTCIASGVVSIDTSGGPKTYALTGFDDPGGPGTYVYSGRVGVAVAGPTWYINSLSSGQTLGDTLVTSFILKECMD